MPMNQYALYTLALSIISILTGTLATIFNPIYIVGNIRFYISNNTAPYLGTQLLTVLLTAALIYPFTKLRLWLFIILVVLASANCCSDFLKTMYQQLLRFNRFAQIELAKSLFIVIVLLCLIAIYREQIHAWQALLIQAAVVVVVVLPLLIKLDILHDIHRIGVGLDICKKILLSEYRYLFGYFFFEAFFGQFAVFMLKIFSTENELATYGSAFRYYSLLVIISSGAVQAVLLPTIQRVISKNEMNQIFNKHRTLIFVYLPIVLIGAITSQWIIPWIDGSKYPNAIRVFQILAASSIFLFTFNPYVNIILRLEKFIFLFVLICIIVIIKLFISIVLIPTFGSIGAAWLTLLGHFMLNMSIFIYAKRIITSLPEKLPMK
jgi:O-antigen/teichoic acid export membrane protein